MKKSKTDTHKSVVSLGQLILQFARTNRYTFHEDGVTPESDTDHTVMLAILACACAEKFAPRLDRGRIAQYALVHDLVEVYAKDTPTLRPMNDEQKDGKKNREKEAFEKIEKEFGNVFPWITSTIREYDSKATSEARFLKIFDSLVCRVTSILNKATTEKNMGVDSVEYELIHQHHRKQILGYASEWPEILDMWDHLSEEAVRGLASKSK